MKAREFYHIENGHELTNHDSVFAFAEAYLQHRLAEVSVDIKAKVEENKSRPIAEAVTFSLGADFVIRKLKEDEKGNS